MIPFLLIVADDLCLIIFLKYIYLNESIIYWQTICLYSKHAFWIEPLHPLQAWELLFYILY